MLKGWWGRKSAVQLPEASGSATVPSRSPRAPAYTPEEEHLLDRIARGIVRFEMTVPAIFLLESSKPLNFVGSQFLHFLSPIVHSIFNARELDRFAAMLEKRETMEELIVRIERADLEMSPSKERGKKAKGKQRGEDGGISSH
jgi:hypothetical protein